MRETPDGKRLLVGGRSLHPTEAQIRLWDEIDRRLPELTRTALDSIVAPTIETPPKPFARDDLTLREVRMEGDGAIELFFDSPLCDDIWAWPCVTIREWIVTESFWTV